MKETALLQMKFILWSGFEYKSKSRKITFCKNRELSEEMKQLRELYKKYGNYFVDLWQYLVIIVIMILAAIFIL